MITPLLKPNCIVISGSAGAIDALNLILPQLREPLPFPIVCVLHMSSDLPNLLVPIFSDKCQLPVKECESTELLQPGTIYFGPNDYHTSLESDGSVSISNEPPVNFSRPSIDVFFTSAAESYKERLCAILLSGANSDGAKGLAEVKKFGGIVIVQDPEDSPFPTMPQMAINLVKPDLILKASEIADKIMWFAQGRPSPMQGDDRRVN